VQTPATAPLTRTERWCLYFLAALVLAFAGLVELRSAFLTRRMTDLGCYLRGAWAARVGEDIYAVLDDNGWHYNYPPLLAVLMVPLADPPPGRTAPWLVPYPVSVALVYALSLACLLLAVHILACALEGSSEDPSFRRQPRFCRRWWALRLWPVLVCLPPVGQTLMRGQVNHLVLALLCAFVAALLRGRRRWAGACLALAACVKVVPAYLFAYPGWRRDRRVLLGCGLGLLAGLVVVPAAALGPREAAGQYRRYSAVLFAPLLKVGEDRSRQDELLGVNSTDCLGLKHAMHNWMYFHRRWDRPDYHPAVVWAHLIGGVLLTLLTLWQRGGGGRGWAEATRFSALVVLMVALSPISHMHYFVFCLPLVMCLLARRWEGRAGLGLGWGLGALVGWFTLANSLPSLPGLDVLKDLCLPLFGALALWAWAVVALWRAGAPAVARPDAGAAVRRLAG
jgi:alpha-1,2-mannosyltransferase